MADADKNQAVRIFLWIIPRVNSTVLLKCMSFVEDTSVWMEPYLTSYLNNTVHNPDHRKDEPIVQKVKAKWQKGMGRPEMVKLMKESKAKASQYSNLYAQATFTDCWIKEQLETEETGKKFILVKDLSFAVFDHLDRLPENVPTKHAFLIRHPAEVYTSYKDRAIRFNDPFNPLSWDECNVAEECIFYPVSEFYQIHHKFWKHVKEHLDQNVFIIDGYDLTSNPDVLLPKIFDKLGIPFRPSYLEWPEDPELIFTSWRGAYEEIIAQFGVQSLSRAIHSTKFESPNKARGVTKPEWKINDELKGYIDAAMPLYEEMYANRLI